MQLVQLVHGCGFSGKGHEVGHGRPSRILCTKAVVVLTGTQGTYGHIHANMAVVVCMYARARACVCVGVSV